MPGATVDVLLAACQSARYLREQLESLLAQDFSDYRVLIRDGGSTDGTVPMIRAWCAEHPDHFRYLGSGTAGTKANFAALLAACEAPYIMFCDHDDRWMPDKVSASLARCRELEAANPAGTPVMVYSDALVTDASLEVIDRSNFHFQHLDPARVSLRDELLQNVPFGNTMCFNRALLDKAGPIPEAAFMHDHWLALTAARFGVIGRLDRPTLCYRQHPENLFGSPCFTLPHLLHQAIFARTQLQQRIAAYCRQAAAFRDRFGTELAPAERAMLEELAGLPEAGFWGRRIRLWRSGARKHGFRRTLGLYVIL